MDETSAAQRSRKSRRTRFIFVLLPFLVVGIWLTVELGRTEEKPSVVLPDGTRVFFECVSRGRLCTPSTDWYPDIPCYEHDEVRVDNAFTRQWRRVIQHTPDWLKGWLPTARYPISDINSLSQHPLRIILRYEGAYLKRWEAWLRDGNGFDSQPLEVQEAKLSGASSGALAVSAYFSRQPHYHLVFRPLDPSSLSSPLYPSRLEPVADLMVPNPELATSPALKGSPPPCSAPLDESVLVLEGWQRGRGGASEANSGMFAGLTLTLSVRRENQREQFYDIRAEEFVLEDGAGNRLANSARARVSKEPGQVLQMPGRYLYLGGGEFPSDDPSLRLTVKAWRTAARPGAFAADELFQFPSVPLQDRGTAEPPLTATALKRNLQLSEVRLSKDSSRYAVIRFSGIVLLPGERLLLVDAHDSQGVKLSPSAIGNVPCFWPVHCAGGNDLEFSLRCPPDTPSLSLTLAIVKPSTVQFVVTPDVVE